MKPNIETQSAIINKTIQMSHVPLIVPVLNHLFRTLLRLGVPMGLVSLLTVRGRKTGKSRRNPVGVFQHNGRSYLFSTFGDVNWVRNLRAAGVATIRHGLRGRTVVPVELIPEDAAPILKDSIAPFLRNRFAEMILGPHFGVKPDASLDEFVEEARRHPVFELREFQST